MVTGNEKYIIDKLNSMSIDEARQAIASGQFGSVGRPDRAFALEWLATKEAKLRDAREEETLSISRNALSISKEANFIASKARSDSRCANIIAIIAIILSTIAIVLQILAKD